MNILIGIIGVCAAPLLIYYVCIFMKGRELHAHRGGLPNAEKRMKRARTAV